MTKVDIISGFLGAGKTTFIKQLLTKVYTNEKVVLIENEFGEIGIDSRFMKDSGIEVTEMNSGCICCTLVGDFAKALKQVVETYSPSRIIIEPSGVGKLSDVAAAVEETAETTDIEINNKITVVDGKTTKMYMENFGEFYNNQLEHASTIVISRTQMMDEPQLTECMNMIKSRNNEATIITTPWEELTGDAIRDALGHSNLQMDAHEHDDVHCHHEHHAGDKAHHDHHDHDHDHGHHHDHNHHHADEIFDSFGMETVRKFSRSEISDILNILDGSPEYGTILRAKGIVEDIDGKWLEFDMVPGESEIRETSADYTGRICVIGTDLNDNKLSSIFHG